MRYLLVIGLVTFFVSCSKQEMKKSDTTQTEESTKGQDDGEDVDYEEADAFNFGPGLGD